MKVICIRVTNLPLLTLAPIWMVTKNKKGCAFMNFFAVTETLISIFAAGYILLILFDAVYDGITALNQRRKSKRA